MGARKSSENIRNLAIAGHSGTGKTTLASALLYTSGVVNRLNKTEDGGTTTDFDEEEIHRGISIGVAPCAVPWNQHKLNLLDCPGYGMFFADTQAAMRATDAVVLCLWAGSFSTARLSGPAVAASVGPGYVAPRTCSPTSLMSAGGRLCPPAKRFNGFRLTAVSSRDL